MAFDGIVTKAIVAELSLLKDARIDKVFQPGKNEVVLGFYINKTNYALNINIDSQNCRINLTTNSKPNPNVAPNFCMVLRKNLIGLKLKNIITLDLERLVILEFEGFDELDDIISKKLVVELMGKHSNIILLDDTNIIIDSLRHIKSLDTNFRDILPHTKYQFPTSNKYNFLEVQNFNNFAEILDLNSSDTLNDLPSKISNVFNGISKNFIYSIIQELEIFELNDASLEKIYNYIIAILDNIGSDNLCFKKLNNDYHLKVSKNNPSFALNFFIDDFYFKKESDEIFNNKHTSLSKIVLDSLNKYKKRLNNINKKLSECDEMDKYRIYGELLTANLYRIPNKNIDEISIENYYDNNNIITIKLDNRYLPSVNAKRFFKKYSKLKNAFQVVSIQKQETLDYLNYLESIIYELDNAKTLADLEIISDEISENEIIKNDFLKKQKNKNCKVKKSKLKQNTDFSFNPLKYTIDGYSVFVGKNNKENDYLTLKFANKSDLWFHTKDFHGSHVILKLDKSLPFPSDNTLYQIAKLAANHSKSKNSSNVPVDYCEVRYVKKPSGSKPGMVIYTNNKTLYV